MMMVYENELRLAHAACPYRRTPDERCDASLTGMALTNPMREKYCLDEDHDGCPIFLSRILRMGF